MKPINLSFAACGFLGIYHLGAASALCKHGQKLLKNVKAFAGASAGSLAASVLLTAPEKIEIYAELLVKGNAGFEASDSEMPLSFHRALPGWLQWQVEKEGLRGSRRECNEFIYQLAEETRRQSLGAATPGYDFMARLRSGMDLILPPDAHEVAHHRLHVSITNTRTRKNLLVSSFSSREDLIQVLLASSFIPVYAGLRPVQYKGQKWMDGGLTNSLPILPGGRTVTISPFSGRLDISPRDKGRLDLHVNISNQDIMLSVANLVRLQQALFPPSKGKLQGLHQRGFADAVQFLRRESWFEDRA